MATSHASPVIYLSKKLDLTFFFLQPRPTGIRQLCNTRNVVWPIKAYFRFRQYLVPTKIPDSYEAFSHDA